jgi:hypothetical protein
MTLKSLLLPIALAGAALVSSCTKTETVVETKLVHDTVLTVPHGPAWIRFISMLPDGGSVTFWTDAQKQDPPFAQALSYSSSNYYPVADSSPLVLYADYFANGNRYLDSINIGTLKQYSLSTIVLYLIENHDGTSHIYASFANDSTKLSDAPAGQAYVRFLNGISDYPSEPKLCLSYDVATNYIWHSGTVPVPSYFATSEIQNYTLVPTGSGPTRHRFYATTVDGEVVDSTNRTLTEGHYYTIRVYGRKSDGTNRMSVDEE